LKSLKTNVDILDVYSNQKVQKTGPAQSHIFMVHSVKGSRGVSQQANFSTLNCGALNFIADSRRRGNATFAFLGRLCAAATVPLPSGPASSFSIPWLISSPSTPQSLPSPLSPLFKDILFIL
jgi:hypothetical protein